MMTKKQSDVLDQENKANLAVNWISSCEAEKLFSCIQEKENEVFPFHYVWLIKMIEKCIEDKALDSMLLILSSVYEVLELDFPKYLDETAQQDLIMQYANELIIDLADIIHQEFQNKLCETKE